MGRSVFITTPIPTLEEVGKRLKMSKARQQRLIEIVNGDAPVRFSLRHRAAATPADARLGSGNGRSKSPAPQPAAKVSPASKKSKRAATS